MSDNLPRILVVDDDEANRYATVHGLQREGFTCLEAASGTEALQLAGQEVDLVLLDVHMPDMDGFTVCRRLKEEPATAAVPVLHLSAKQVDDESRVQGLEAGADGYLVQPLDPSVLASTIRAHLRAGAALREQQRLARRLSAIYEAIQDGIFVLTLDGTVLDCNSALLAILGKEREQVVGHPCHQTVCLDGVRSPGCPREEMVATGRRATATMERDGRVYRLSIDPLFDDDGTMVGGVHLLSDITEIHTLRGLLPICASCKKIRSDDGYWHQLETYLAQHSPVVFSHGICDDCLEKLYPEMADDIRRELAAEEAQANPTAKKE